VNLCHRRQLRPHRRHALRHSLHFLYWLKLVWPWIFYRMRRLVDYRARRLYPAGSERLRPG
jgi:hypothetical protein